VLGAGSTYRRGDRVRFTEGPFLDNERNRFAVVWVGGSAG
jgi:hypothetical protein